MSNQEQLEEVEAVVAFYDGSEDIELSIAEPPGTSGSDDLEVPSFELSSTHLTQQELSRLCRQLDILFRENGAPILFAWLEWLRTEVVAFLTSSSPAAPEEESLDARAIVAFQRQEKEAVSKCTNCGLTADRCGPCVPLGACAHAICGKCAAAVMQVSKACGVEPCCPLPQCRAGVPHGVEPLAQSQELWSSVTRRILGTPFQDNVVFCPRCEDLGIDSPVLMPSHCTLRMAETGSNQTHCFCCRLDFCGVCRSPSHPGKACFSEPRQIVRMSQRRPPLPAELHATAVQGATHNEERQRRLDREFRAQVAVARAAAAGARTKPQKEEGFKVVRREFLARHGEEIRNGLGAVFKAGVHLTPAPLSPDVRAQFMKECDLTGVAIRPALHGTNASNYPSIFKRGLLVPGVGNELQIVHGAAHGYGIYTANVESAWLSFGFCSERSMLVCAVLHGKEVRHHGDAMIVARSELVAPLFLATEELTQRHKSAPGASRVIKGIARQQAAKACTVAADDGAEDPETESKPKTGGKSAKFKARMAARSQRR